MSNHDDRSAAEGLRAPNPEGLPSVEALAEAIYHVTGIGGQETEHGIEYDLDGARAILARLSPVEPTDPSAIGDSAGEEDQP